MIGVNVWWAYLGPQDIHSAVVLTLSNKVVVYFHCIVDVEDHRVNPKLLKLLCGCSLDDVPRVHLLPPLFSFVFCLWHATALWFKHTDTIIKVCYLYWWLLLFVLSYVFPRSWCIFEEYRLSFFLSFFLVVVFLSFFFFLSFSFFFFFSCLF